MESGLYIHVPFCHARCGYCDFVTFTGKEDRIDGYVADLCAEIRLYPRQNISTIFFGGGTPSLLEPHHVSQILDAVRSHFDLNPDAEVTLEANPESVTLEKAVGWRMAGINRMSLGLQAFDDQLLKKMDRLHNVQQFLDAYRAVRGPGFDNVSIDLIYGFAEQSLEDWKKTVQATVQLQPEHLSLYALKIEEHTPFAARGYRVSDDHEADLYEWARAFLKTEGYEHYEISNFSRSGKACRHNLIYWRQRNYLGLGVGAVGCVDGLRWENHKNLQDYHRDISAGTHPRVSTENLDANTRRFERLMLGLRLREGFEWPENNPEWLAHRSQLAARGLLEEVRPGHWRIPDSAVSLTNQILLPFLS
jgi:oxygen-independent coproporphyrinogen-3 oxidase